MQTVTASSMLRFTGFVCVLLAQLVSARLANAQEESPLPLGYSKTLSFQGPATSEDSPDNPFTDYRLLVTFQHAETLHVVRGFYAADGNAAETGADSGAVWKVRFAPDRVGKWNYAAELRRGGKIAIDDRPDRGEIVELQNATGSFEVTARRKAGGSRDFRDTGRLVVDNGYFRLGAGGPRLLKAGANSPENLLAYQDFDDTYRLQGKARDGEARAADRPAPLRTAHRRLAAGRPDLAQR